jgi:hypothetical protein
MEVWFGIDDPDERRDRYSKAIDALQDDDIDTWLVHAGRAGVSDGAAGQFRSHWLESPMVCDMPATEMRDTFKSGFAAALTAARDANLKTSMAVMIADTFDVDYVVGANAVTVIITIPASAVPPADAS